MQSRLQSRDLLKSAVQISFRLYTTLQDMAPIERIASLKVELKWMPFDSIIGLAMASTESVERDWN